MCLSHVPSETPFRVVSVHGSDPTTMRMMEMGVIEGAEIAVVRRAPLGDPLQVRLGDYELSIRSRDAARVDVVPI